MFQFFNFVSRKQSKFRSRGYTRCYLDEKMLDGDRRDLLLLAEELCRILLLQVVKRFITLTVSFKFCNEVNSGR